MRKPVLGQNFIRLIVGGPNSDGGFATVSAMGKKHSGDRSKKSGLARVKGSDGRKHVEQKKPHVPQRIVYQGPYAPKPRHTRSTKKEE